MMKLTDKEKSRAFPDGTTVIVRPQAWGGYMVAAVDIHTGEPVFVASFVESKEGISAAVAAEVRMLDKCGMGVESA